MRITLFRARNRSNVRAAGANSRSAFFNFSGVFLADIDPDIEIVCCPDVTINTDGVTANQQVFKVV